MGLDNGLYLVRKKNAQKSFLICFFDWLKYSSNENEDVYEIFYFRKAWGVRGEVLSIVRNSLENKGSYPVSTEMLYDILKVLKRFNHRRYWNQNSGSIFEYKEMRRLIWRYIFNMRLLLLYMKRHHNDELFFEDSY